MSAPDRAALAGSASAEAGLASISQPREVLPSQAAPGAQPAAEEVQEALYGKSVAWCPAAGLFAVCLGGSGRRARDMQLLVALSGGGGVAAVSRLQHASADTQGEPAHSPAWPVLKLQPVAQAQQGISSFAVVALSNLCT